MTFKFSDVDQRLIVHHFSHEGFYLSTSNILIEANTGLPANSTTDAVPGMSDNHIAVYENSQWVVKVDLRNQTAYAKIGDIDQNYIVNDVGVLPDTHTLIQPEKFDSWTDDGWKHDIELERPVKAVIERNWRDSTLANVLSRIDQYEKDQHYPIELRTSPFTADQYNLLLQDRKRLSDYPSVAKFPFVERPTLLGLV